MLNVFFSYSHRDETLRDELEIHMSSLKREGAIKAWHDRRIGPGTEFAGEIDDQLETADIVLLLVSPYFIASDYCIDVELRRALERHEAGEARVVPVILHPCDWHSTAFGQLLAVPKDGKPVSKYPNQHDAFLEVTLAIREIAQELRPDSNRTTHDQAPAPEVSHTSRHPRSSNLRIRKEFSERDQDAFLDECFAYITKFFEASLVEVENRNTEIETRFKLLDATAFTAHIYVKGAVGSECRISLGGIGSRGNHIQFSFQTNQRGNSFNEQLTVDDDGHALFMKPMGMASIATDKDQLLSEHGAAEYLWAILIQPLQQQ